MANYRNRPLLDLAHEIHECQCCGAHVEEGCEPAHSNMSEHGKGVALKSHDCFHAALCHGCHSKLDQGRDLTREERREMWRRAHDRTMLEYWGRGWVRVA